jgi:hypothetical protein
MKDFVLIRSENHPFPGHDYMTTNHVLNTLLLTEECGLSSHFDILCKDFKHYHVQVRKTGAYLHFHFPHWSKDYDMNTDLEYLDSLFLAKKGMYSSNDGINSKNQYPHRSAKPATRKRKSHPVDPKSSKVYETHDLRIPFKTRERSLRHQHIREEAAEAAAAEDDANKEEVEEGNERGAERFFFDDAWGGSRQREVALAAPEEGIGDVIEAVDSEPAASGEEGLMDDDAIVTRLQQEELEANSRERSECQRRAEQLDEEANCIRENHKKIDRERSVVRAQIDRLVEAVQVCENDLATVTDMLQMSSTLKTDNIAMAMPHIEIQKSQYIADIARLEGELAAAQAKCGQLTRERDDAMRQQLECNDRKKSDIKQQTDELKRRREVLLDELVQVELDKKLKIALEKLKVELEKERHVIRSNLDAADS